MNLPYHVIIKPTTDKGDFFSHYVNVRTFRSWCFYTNHGQEGVQDERGEERAPEFARYDIIWHCLTYIREAGLISEADRIRFVLMAQDAYEVLARGA